MSKEDASAYDFEDRLIRRTRSDGVTIDLTYEANGNCIAKTVTRPSQPTESTSYLIDSAAAGGWPQCVEDSKTVNALTTKTVYQYGPSGPISQQTDTQPEQDYLLDAHGSIRALISPTGQVSAAADYDAYGTPLTTGGTTSSSLGYNGEYYDLDLGLIYLRARFYDPTTGRFLNRDPYQGALEDPMSLNSYQFAGADPVDQIDPSGNFSLAEMVQTIRLQAELNRERIVNLQKITNRTRGIVLEIQILQNYAASVVSIFENMSATSFRKLGETANWTLQGKALFQAYSYQDKMRKELRDDVKRYEAVWKDTTEALAFASYEKAIATSIANNAAKARENGDTVVEAKALNLLPEFTPVATTGHIVWIDGLHGSDGQDFRKADSEVLTMFKGQNAGDTWHHHEVMGIMQSVAHKYHKIKHWGGARMYKAITGSGYPNRN